MEMVRYGQDVSVRVMTFIFGLEDLSSRDKFVALAYADHANDVGENIYPARNTIAKKTGHDPRTVTRATRHLVEIGLFISDGKGPNNVNKWKVNLSWVGTESPDLETQALTESPPGIDTVPPKPSVNHQPKTLTNPKEGLVVTPELEYVDIEPKKPKSKHKPLVGALTRVSGLDVRMHGARLGRSAKKLSKAGYTPDQVEAAFGKGGAWYSRDWRGKKGDKPTPEFVVEQIANLLESDSNKYITGEHAEYINH